MLDNKKIVIIGAAGLLGTELVKALLSNNAEVIALDINLDTMNTRFMENDIDTSNKNISCHSMDITNENDVKDFFLKLTDIDGAVNCSYPRNSNYGANFFDVSLKDFNENINLHLGSSFIFMQQCAQFFLNNPRSFSLVNIASIYGVIAPKFDIYNNTEITMPIEYAGIKAAIIHMNKYVSKYVNNTLFRVNSVSPGGIGNNQAKEFIDAYKKNTLGKGMLSSSDITGTIIFLLSDMSSNIVGQNIVVDDGFSL